MASSTYQLSQSQTACEAVFFLSFFFFYSRVPAAGNDDDDLALAIVTASKYALRPKVEVSYERMPRSESERLKNGLRR